MKTHEFVLICMSVFISALVVSYSWVKFMPPIKVEIVGGCRNE